MDIRLKDNDTNDYRIYESLLQQQIQQIDDKLAEYHRQTIFSFTSTY